MPLQHKAKGSRKNRYRLGVLIGSILLFGFFQNCGPNFKADLAGSSEKLESGSQAEPGGALPAWPPPVPVGNTVTDLKIQNLLTSAQSNVPFTFGQPFPQGALLKSETLTGKLSNGNSINLQVEVKSTHPDGSARHAVISGVLPALGTSSTETLSLIKAIGGTVDSASLSPQSILNSGFGANATLNVGGITYTASAQDFLGTGKYQSWLSGPLVNEWLVVAPLKTAAGAIHPHLVARFDIRSYTGLNKVRVDVVIENGWNYEPAPQNFTYDVKIQVGGQLVYSKTALKHFHHARWKKSFWWGSAPAIHLRHNTSYLILSRALPNYDPTVVIAEDTLAGLQKNLTPEKSEPMNFGIAESYMPTTGGRPDIGLNPSWAVSYLLSQDVRAKTVTLTQADLAGSWSIHYRDKNKDLPHSIFDWPYSGLNGTPGDKINPATKKSEDFPACVDCAITSSADVSHMPNLAYIPYLVTGDHYYMEELQFSAAFTAFTQNPYYREFTKGLIKSEQLRGQGWALRLLGEAGAFTPDNHPLKAQFNEIVNQNMDWYNANYTHNPSANKLGVIVTGYSISYNNGRGIAPWMDDFFTQAVGHLTELGYTKALPLLAWKAKFSIARLTDPGYCWIQAPLYSLNLRDSETAPFYTTMAETYRATVDPTVQATACASAEMAAAMTKIEGSKMEVGSMGGYPWSNTGYAANMQPAIAYSATSGAPNGLKAWDQFMKRSVKPTYTDGAQFAIVPRR